MNIEYLIDLKTKLIKNKQLLRERYEDSIKEIDDELMSISNTFKLIDELLISYKCDCCDGNGAISRTDAAGGIEYTTCPRCGGTGLILGDK